MHILIANILKSSTGNDELTTSIGKIATGIGKIAYWYCPNRTIIDEIVYQGNNLAFSRQWYPEGSISKSVSERSILEFKM